MQRKHVFRVIPRVFGNFSKSGNIWGGDFYRTWTVKLTLPAPNLLMLYQTLTE